MQLLNTKGPAKRKWLREPIKPEDIDIESLLLNQYFYDQGLVKMLHEEHGEILQTTIGSVGEYIARNDSKTSFKIEGMERYSEKIWGQCVVLSRAIRNDMLSLIHMPISCHCFVAKPGSVSFPNHTDPDDVCIYVIDGEKKVIITTDGKERENTVGIGEYILIPHGTTHRVINEKASIMLSIGFDRYHMDKKDA